jgi:hypothetical protein
MPGKDDLQMIYQTANIFCTRHLTISDLYPKTNMQEDCACSGFNGKNLFRSFLHFDIEDISADAAVSRAVLRIYIRRLITPNRKSELLVLPLLSEFDNRTGFLNQPEYMGAVAALEVCRNYAGWLDFDLTQICRGWVAGEPHNHGVMLMSDENTVSIFDIFALEQCNYMLMPHLIVYYTSQGQGRRPRAVKTSPLEVRERCWNLNFKGSEMLSPINVERMKEGTFFVKNEGAQTIKAIVETGADPQDFAEDTCYDVLPGKTAAVVAKFYGKYYRLTLLCADRTCAKVRFIGQDYN